VKKFTWSWSRLKNYRVCPKKHYHVDIAKEFPEPDNEVLVWGNQVHAAMAARIEKGTKLPLMMEHYDEWPANLAALKGQGMEVKTEQKLAMSEAFRPTSFFDNATWFRGVADVLATAETTAITVDWKTGQIKPDAEQLALNAQLIFSHYPKVELVETIYVWLGNDDHTTKRFSRADMLPLWSGLMPEINQLAEAHRTTTYPPKPSGICVRHCPVISCPYHGKGSPR